MMTEKKYHDTILGAFGLFKRNRRVRTPAFPVVLEQNFDRFLKVALDLRHAHSANKAITISFTSARPGEGATTMVCNMAFALASNLAKKTVLVDAGSRKAGPMRFFGLAPKQKGIFDFLAGRVTIEEILNVKVTNNLVIIPAGNIPKHPIVAFEGKKIHAFLQELRSRFDFILFDTPAVVVSPVTPVLSALLDVTLFVVEAEKTRWEVAKHAKDTLHDAGAFVPGVFLNKKQMIIPDFIYKYIL